jgi:curved DNA-binding protein CbpA
MSEFVLNFNTLKFNLYEILNIQSDASNDKIKKAFRNLIKHFHPDKNNDAEEEIYYHIITANQILTNPTSRKLYDNFLNKKENTHDELKNNYFDNKHKIIPNSGNKSDNNTVFNKKFESDLFVEDVIDIKTRYNKMIRDRETNINIINENFINNDDFNNKFIYKMNNGTFEQQIIPINEKQELSIYNNNDDFTSIDIAYNNLYIDGQGISTSKFTSIESAFKLSPISILSNNYKQTNIKEEMEKYKKDINYEYKSDLKYESW